MTKNEVDINNTLLNDYDTPSSLFDGPYTKTTQFMLPSININVKSDVIFKFFINAFLDDKEHPHNYTRPVFVLFGVDDFNSKEWKNAYNILTSSKDYICDYDCGMQEIQNYKRSTIRAYLVMIVFQIPQEFEEDYYHFKRGRYSRFSTKYRERFPRHVDASNKESILWRIINKSADLKRELEVEFKMNDLELDKTTTWRGKTYPVAEEIWDIPRKDREYYRYEDIPISR